MGRFDKITIVAGRSKMNRPFFVGIRLFGKISRLEQASYEIGIDHRRPFAWRPLGTS
jgi:hypothetical protein